MTYQRRLTLLTGIVALVAAALFVAASTHAETAPLNGVIKPRDDRQPPCNPPPAITIDGMEDKSLWRVDSANAISVTHTLVQGLNGLGQAIRLDYNLGARRDAWVQIRRDFTEPVRLGSADHLRFYYSGTTTNTLQIGLIGDAPSDPIYFSHDMVRTTHVPWATFSTWDLQGIRQAERWSYPIATTAKAIFISVKVAHRDDVGGVGSLTVDELQGLDLRSRCAPDDFDPLITDTLAVQRAAEWIGQQQQANGLVASWPEEGRPPQNKHFAWLYDQALALLVFTDHNRPRADHLAEALVALQMTATPGSTGWWYDGYDYTGSLAQPRPLNPSTPIGSNAWAVYALGTYCRRGGHAAGACQAAERGARWLSQYQRVDGSLPATPCEPTAPTEPNLDAWWAFQVTGRHEEAQRLQTYLLTGAWDERMGRFKASPDDYQIFLDNQTWGAAFLRAIGRPADARRALSYARATLSTRSINEQVIGFDGAGPFNVWTEGTLQYVAQRGLNSQDYWTAMLHLQSAAGSLPGSAESRNFEGYIVWLTQMHGIAPTAWFYFAGVGGPLHISPEGLARPWLSFLPYLAAEASTAKPYQSVLATVARDTWQYLSSDWATDNHLPWSWRSEICQGGDYANPAEIGLYMLSYIGAFDLDQPWSPSWETVEREIGATLDQLRDWQTGGQNYQPHGPNAYQNSVFYQTYWINWDQPVVGGNVSDHDVPSVDNAWLALSLLVIREYAEAHDSPTLAQKADTILGAMDFGIWYHPLSHRFRWKLPDGSNGPWLADDYSSENRIINFVARALGQLSREEYLASLEALAQCPGVYDRGTTQPDDDIVVKAVNWDGSYFTYTAPGLFIQERDTVYGRDTINPATKAQIAYAAEQGYPVWGISDSFNVDCLFYVERGAPPRRSKKPDDDLDDGLIASHASALALNTSYHNAALINLMRLKENYPGLYDPRYGFRDTVNVKTGAISSRFSALGQEWTFLALVNTLNHGSLWRYLYNDAGVQQAHREMFGSPSLRGKR